MQLECAFEGRQPFIPRNPPPHIPWLGKHRACCLITVRSSTTDALPGEAQVLFLGMNMFVMLVGLNLSKSYCFSVWIQTSPRYPSLVLQGGVHQCFSSRNLPWGERTPSPETLE